MTSKWLTSRCLLKAYALHDLTPAHPREGERDRDKETDPGMVLDPVSIRLGLRVQKGRAHLNIFRNLRLIVPVQCCYNSVRAWVACLCFRNSNVWLTLAPWSPVRVGPGASDVEADVFRFLHPWWRLGKYSSIPCRFLVSAETMEISCEGLQKYSYRATGKTGVVRICKSCHTK